MPTPTTCVFDIVGSPRRAGTSDVGGCAKGDDQFFPPDPVLMLTSADANQWANLIVRYGQVVPMAVLSIHFSGGAPSVASCTSVGAAVVIGTFTVTDNGTGDTTISWPANTFAPLNADHDARCTGATMGSATTATGSHSARVRTANAAGAATDLPFNLAIWGD